MKKNILIFVAVALVAIFAAPVFAQVNPPDGFRLEGTTEFDEPGDIFTLLNRIADWIFVILLTVAVIYVLLAAYSYLTSKGGEGVEKGHKMILWAAVAIAVALLAKGFVNVVRILIVNK